jgi:hypothetical protein
MSEDKSTENGGQPAPAGANGGRGDTEKPEEKPRDKPVEKEAEKKAETPAEPKKEEPKKEAPQTQAPAAEKPAEPQAPKEAKKEEAPVKKEKPSNCAACNKPIRKKQWYYRNGKFYCTKTCWRAAAEKEEKKPEAPVPPA